MGLYNVVFGMNPQSEILLGILGLDRGSVGRFRDAFVTPEGEIAVYTRNGGGNRDCWYEWTDDPDEKAKANTAECECVGCFMAYRVASLPGYVRDEDDDFDCTYATIFFTPPAEWAELVAALGKRDEAPNERWLRVIDELREAPDLDALNATLARARAGFNTRDLSAVATEKEPS